MRLASFFLLALLSAGPVAAQEVDAELAVRAPALGAVEEAEARYALRGGAPARTGRMGVVAPRVCTYREYDIPDETADARAGEVLRLFRGECATDALGYVHNPTRMRITEMLTERRAVALLDLLGTDNEPQAP